MHVERINQQRGGTIRRMDGAAYFRELYLAHCAACVQAGIPVPTPDAWVDTLDAYISERAQDGLQDDAGEPT